MTKLEIFAKLLGESKIDEAAQMLVTAKGRTIATLEMFTKMLEESRFDDAAQMLVTTIAGGIGAGWDDNRKAVSAAAVMRCARIGCLATLLKDSLVPLFRKRLREANAPPAEPVHQACAANFQAFEALAAQQFAATDDETIGGVKRSRKLVRRRNGAL